MLNTVVVYACVVPCDNGATIARSREASLLRRDSRWHDSPLRRVPLIQRRLRSAETLALAAKVPVKVVSGMLGHKSVKLTLDVYAHSLPGMHESAVEALEAAF